MIFPVSLNEFLRRIVGGQIGSARTLKRRMKFFLDFLPWWKQRLLTPPTLPPHEAIIEMTNPKFRDGNWTAETIVKHYSEHGFTNDEYLNMEWIFFQWSRLRRHRRAKIAAAARWKHTKKPVLKKISKEGKTPKKFSSSINKHSPSIKSPSPSIQTGLTKHKKRLIKHT